MLAARILLAALLAIAAVLLPIGCRAGQASSPVISVAMHSGTDMPCCPQKPSKTALVFCALQCGSIVAAGAPAATWRPFYTVGTVIAVRRDPPLAGQTVQPPTHPPRA